MRRRIRLLLSSGGLTHAFPLENGDSARSASRPRPRIHSHPVLHHAGERAHGLLGALHVCERTAGFRRGGRLRRLCFRLGNGRLC